MESKKLENNKKIKRKVYSGFGTYIEKVLKQVHPDTSIKTSTKKQISELLIILARELSKRAHSSIISLKQETITSRHIQYAVQCLIPAELAKHAIAEGTKAVTKLNAELVDHQKGGKKETDATRSGLTFSVSRCKNYIKMFTGTMRVARGAPVYLAAVLEYMCAEILELAGNAARDSRLVTITTRHVFLALANDIELLNLCDLLKIELERSGVVPRIEDALLPLEKKPRKKKTKLEPRTKKTKGSGSSSSVEESASEEKRSNTKKSIRAPHRFRSGTVALREIRRQQRSIGLCLQKSPFERIVRQQTSKFNDDSRFSSKDNSILHIQYFIEQRIICIFKQAQKLALLARRGGIKSSDIMESIQTSVEPRLLFNNVYEVSDLVVTNPGIKRLARRGGVKIISGSVYETVARLINQLVYNLCELAIVEMTNRRMKTITPEVLRSAIYLSGYYFIF